ncbi:MAG: regulatory signaling modulator protein AmpE [Thiotrichales bacterium]
MTFLSVLIALLLERFGNIAEGLRRHDGLQRLFAWLDVRLGQYQLFNGWLGLIAMLLPLILVADWVYDVFDDWLFGLVGIALSVAILLFSLGPKDVDRALADYLAVPDDDPARGRIYQEITGDPPPAREATRVEGLIRGAFIESNHRLFGVLFWFVAAGPMGALLYRLSKELYQVDQAYLVRLRAYAEVWFGILNWLPARLLTFTLALVAGFDQIWPVCKSRFTQYIERVQEDNRGLLGDAGIAAVELERRAREAGDRGGHEVAALEQAAIVLRRALIVWIVLLALLTLLRWV